MTVARDAHAGAAEPARERLALRLSGSQKEQLQQAAALRGMSLSEFVLHVATDAAWRTLREREVMVLSERDSEAFAAALLAPPAPGPRLRRAAERYASRLRDQ